MKNRKIPYFALCLAFVLSFCSCSSKITFEGHPSSEYITALANGEYSLEMSMLYGGTIITNKLTVSGGDIESISTIGESASHSLRIDNTTYFVDDESKVYFAANVSEQNGLYGSIDYASAEYLSSGTDTLATGSTYGYDEYECATRDGEKCTVRLYVADNGSLVALVNSNGEEIFEQDISYFSDKPSKIKLPKSYTELDEDTYFNDYYGK